MSAYFLICYYRFAIFHIAQVKDTTISLCISNVGIIRTPITAAQSNLKAQPPPYQALHISGGRLPQTPCKTSK